MIPMGAVPYVVGAALLAGSLGLAYFKGYANGSASRNPEFVELRSQIERSRLAALAAEKRAEEAAQKVRIEYRTKVETVIQEREAARELIEVVRRDASCDLPPAYRQLWDGNPPAGNPADQGSSRVDGAPVSMADAAETAAEAKKRFALNAAKIEGWQKLSRANGWVSEESKSNFLDQIQEAPLPK